MMLDIKFPNWKCQKAGFEYQKAGFIAESVTKELDFGNDSYSQFFLIF